MNGEIRYKHSDILITLSDYYGFFMEISNDVPRELLEQFEIPQMPIIFRGSKSLDKAAK